MVDLPSCGDMRSPSSPEGRGRGRRVVVGHRLPLPPRAVPSPDAPYGFNFYLDTDALPFKHSRGFPGDVAAASSVPASDEIAARLLERFSCSTGAKKATRDISTRHVVSKVYLPADNHRMMLRSSSEQDLAAETRRTYYESILLARSSSHNRDGKYRSILQDNDDTVSPQGLNNPLAKKKLSTSSEGLFFSGGLTSDKPILSTNNNPEYHKIDKYRSLLQDNDDDMVSSQGLNNKTTSTIAVLQLPNEKMLISEAFYTRLILEISSLDGESYRSSLHDYGDMVSLSLQRLNKPTTLEINGILKVLCLDPNNTTSFVSGRRKDISIIWLALHKLMSAEHGCHIICCRSKSCQLVAACNSSTSAGQSGVAMLRPSRPPLIRFLLDSGASMHVVGDAGLLHHLRDLPRAAAARFATLPDGSRLPIVGVGTIQMNGFSIPNVYLVEGVTVNLVSVSRLTTEHGICCCFYGNRCQLMLLADGRARVIGEAVLDDDGVYSLRFLRVPEGQLRD